MTRLSTATLAGLPAHVTRPGYDRGAIRSGVVHLGIGAFHRAHQAQVFERALAAGDLRWGITGASLRSPAVRDEMMPQDGLYTIVTRDGATDSHAIIGAVREVLVAPEDPGALVARLAHRDTHVVTLTITEKGYPRDPAETLEAPRSAAGYLAAALAARRAAGLAPFTAISCDNLPHNGRRLEQEVIAAARAHDPALAGWIERDGAFPETMVDRIVPATTPADIAALADAIGVEDLAMVKAEPFLQWVIEDRFCGPVPDFELAGAQVTRSVAPWEEAKLRLLNGAHSAIAYLGGLAGIECVDRVVAEADFAALVEALWDEAEATLSPPPGLDIEAYRGQLMARFANSALAHRTRQIAMDGSQKLPQRLLAPIAARAARGLPSPILTLAVAAWMRWQDGRDDSGTAHVVDDPMAAQIADRLRGARDAAARVAALLSIEAIFPPQLAGDAGFARALSEALAALTEQGARATVSDYARRAAVRQ